MGKYEKSFCSSPNDGSEFELQYGLRIQQHGLQDRPPQAEAEFNTGAFWKTPGYFGDLVESGAPEDIQAFLWLLVRKVEWSVKRNHTIQFYGFE